MAGEFGCILFKTNKKVRNYVFSLVCEKTHCATAVRAIRFNAFGFTIDEPPGSLVGHASHMYRTRLKLSLSVLLAMRKEGAAPLNAGLSDRMSRSEMAVLLPSPPTALQVLIAHIVNGIVETKILDILAACSKWAGWAHLVADDVWQHNTFV